MIAALVQGTLVRAPEQKTSKAGHSYVSATLKVRDGDATQWVRVTAFSNTAQADLLRLADGDALSAQGRLSAEIYTGIDNIPKISLSIVADQILPLRQPPRERKTKAAAERVRGSWRDERDGPCDEIPFSGRQHEK
jgi:single-stranded DNA-binding protein